jgi:uncharacterized membrane protein YccC
MVLFNPEKAVALQEKLGLTNDQLYGIRFAINVAIATTIVWVTLWLISNTNPIWAIASMIAASEPEPKEARRMFKSRLINVLVGCVIGLVFLTIGGAAVWKLPVALATTVIVSTFMVKVKTMWRQAPITAAVVIAAGIIQESDTAGIWHGLHKVAEVIFGCFVGICVSLLMSKLWIIKLPEKK